MENKIALIKKIINARLSSSEMQAVLQKAKEIISKR